jgi:hypothetical protein
MRLVAGTVLIFRAAAGLSGALAIGPPLLLVFQTGLGLLLLAGLWTPIAGTFAAVLALWRLFSHYGEPWIQVLLATLGVSLALLGPASGRSTLACLDGRVDIDRQRRLPTIRALAQIFRGSASLRKSRDTSRLNCAADSMRLPAEPPPQCSATGLSRHIVMKRTGDERRGGEL